MAKLASGPHGKRKRKENKKKWTKKALRKMLATKDVLIPHQIKQLKSDPHAKISLSKKKLRKLGQAKQRDDREKERMEIEPAMPAAKTRAECTGTSDTAVACVELTE